MFDCADACIYDTSCKSINLDKNTDPWKCELVVDDRNTLEEYTDAPGVNHYDTGLTALTMIVSNAGGSCLVSENLVCEFTSAFVPLRIEMDISVCNANRAALFYYDIKHGYLIHHCSGRPVGVSAGVNGAADFVAIFQTTAPYAPNIHEYTHIIRRNFSK